MGHRDSKPLKKHRKEELYVFRDYSGPYGRVGDCSTISVRLWHIVGIIICIFVSQQASIN